MKKTSILLTALLSLVCLVCGAVGLAACGGDPVIKVGDTELSNVKHDGKTYKIEAEADKVYTLTAKVDGKLSNEVYLEVSEDCKGFGEVEFEYEGGKEYSVKVSAYVKLEGSENLDAKASLDKVVITMAVKPPRTPVDGELEKPYKIDLDTFYNYSVNGNGVYYTVNVTETNFYYFELTGDDDYLDIAVGSGLNAAEDDILNDVERNTNGNYTLVKGTTYYVRLLSEKKDADNNIQTITGTFKLKKYVEEVLELSFTEPLTIPSLSESVVVNIKLSEEEMSDTYTITAYEGNSNVPSDKVLLVVGREVGVNPVENYTYNVANTRLSVELAEEVTGPVTSVRVVMDKVEEEVNELPPLKIGENIIEYTGNGYSSENFVLEITEAGNYKFKGFSSWDVCIGTELFNGSEIDGVLNPDSEDNEGATYNLQAGKYYVGAYAGGTLTIEKV